MKLILVANSAFTLLNFRKELMLKLVSLGYAVTAICPDECSLTNCDVRKEFYNLGVSYYPVKFSRNGLNVFSDIKFLFHLSLIFKEVRPDYVLNYTIKPFIYGSIAAKLFRNIKVLSNVTGLGYIFTDNSFKVRVLRSLVLIQLKLASKCNDVIFFQNPDDLSDYYSWGVVNKKQFTKIINGSGVNLDEFPPIQSFEKKDVHFLFIGRLIKDKGIYELIESAKIIKSLYEEVVIDVVGPIDSNPNSLKKSDIEEFSANGLVNYHGSTNNVLPFLRKCDVFVLPSYREGTPRTILEALAVGRPIITTNAPGCRECVVDGKNGYTVPVRNTHELVIAMTNLIESPQLRLEMGAESRQVAESKYDVNIVVRDIIDAIEQC